MVARGSTEQAGAAAPRRLLGFALSAAWVLGAVVVGWFLWPTSLGGCTTLTIVSGHSMEPTYYTGDLVVSRCGDVGVGDVITYRPPDIDGVRVYHAGDTERIPEMKTFKADIAMVPMDGEYTMPPEEAAQCVKDVGAVIAIPMHYWGSDDKEARFKRAVGGKAQVMIKIPRTKI